MAQMTKEYCGNTSGIANGQLYNLNNYVNVDNTMSQYVQNIVSAEEQGNYDAARLLADSYKSQFGNFIFSAESINAIEEETRNLEIYGMSQQSIFYEENEPGYAMISDVWIGV